MTEDAGRTRSKALGINRDGRLRLLTVQTDVDGVLQRVDAIVYGHNREHIVAYATGHGWVCSCGQPPLCSHALSAEMVCHGEFPHGISGQPKFRVTRPVRRG